MSYYIREFPGSLVVITPCFCCRGTGSVPGQVTKIPHAVQLSKKKKKRYPKLGNKWHTLTLVCWRISFPLLIQ